MRDCTYRSHIWRPIISIAVVERAHAEHEIEARNVCDSLSLERGSGSWENQCPKHDLGSSKPFYERSSIFPISHFATAQLDDRLTTYNIHRPASRSSS